MMGSVYMKKGIFYNLIEISKIIMIALIISILLEKHIIGLTIVDGESMLNTIRDNDKVLINKICYSFNNPKRGDIIVFTPPIKSREDELFIKRVVAISGDKFKVEDNKIYINDSLLNESYILDNEFSNRNYSVIEGVVSDGYVFVMGDNRGNSNDSRNFGLVPIKNIKGKAITKIWPVNGMRSLAVQYND